MMNESKIKNSILKLRYEQGKIVNVILAIAIVFVLMLVCETYVGALICCILAFSSRVKYLTLESKIRKIRKLLTNEQ